MTTLATYTFASGAALSGVTVRAYACGRYLNNSGTSKFPTFTTTLNGVTQVIQAVTVQSSPVAIGWRVWAHFYFTTQLTYTGNQLSVGSNLDILTTNAFANATQNGGYASPLLAIDSNPYNNLLIPATQTTLALVFASPGGDVIEQHAGYMEAL